MFASSGATIFQEMENYNFPRVFFHCFIIFFHFCFQWWNWWKMIKHDEKWFKKMIKNNEKNMKNNSRKIAIFQKMKNCNFPRVFFIFLNFIFIFFFIVYHFSSFLLPVVQKFCKKRKITIFLKFFSFFCHFFHCFCHFFKIFASSGGIDEKW